MIRTTGLRRAGGSASTRHRAAAALRRPKPAGVPTRGVGTPRRPTAAATGTVPPEAEWSKAVDDEATCSAGLPAAPQRSHRCLFARRGARTGTGGSVAARPGDRRSRWLRRRQLWTTRPRAAPCRLPLPWDVVVYPPLVSVRLRASVAEALRRRDVGSASTRHRAAAALRQPTPAGL